MDRLLHGHWLAPSNSMKESDVVRIVERERASDNWAGWVSQIGVGTTVDTTPHGLLTPAGSATALLDATGPYINYASSALIGNIAGWSAPSVANVRLEWLSDFMLVMKTGLDISQIRIWNGFQDTTGSPGVNVPNPTGFFGFRYSNVSADTTGGDDTTWHVIAAAPTGGVAQATTFVDLDTEVTVATDTRYVLHVNRDEFGDLTYYINGEAVAAIGSANVELPPVGTALFPRGYFLNGIASSRSIRLRRWILRGN